MLHVSRKSKRNVLLFLAVLLLGVIVNFTVSSSHSAALYCALIFAWLLSARRRILIAEIRRYLALGAALLLLLFLLRIFRYELADLSPRAGRYLWYAYYIPFTAVPLCSLCAALCVGTDETKEPLRRVRWLWFADGLLVAAILLNDLHGAMFRIVDHESAKIYEYGFLYYLTVLWCAALSVASLVTLIRRCRLSGCRRFWGVPAAAAALGTGLLVWYFLAGGSPTAGGWKLYNLQEAYAFLFISFWECCIQIGLIPSNTDYDEIFQRSPLNAFITDKTGRVAYHAAGAEIPGGDALAAALSGPVFLDEGRVLRSAPIRRGASYWIEDVSKINGINGQIAGAIEFLEEEGNLLTEENRVKTERTLYETQNKLYDSISPVVQPQLGEIRRLLAADDGDEAAFQRRLLHAMVLSVYVKRRVNLALIAHDSPCLPVRELELAIREAAEVLALRGVFVSVHAGAGAGTVPAAQAVLAYDFFEEALERALPGLSALLAEIGGTEDFRLELTLGTPTERVREAWRSRQLAAQGGKLSLAEEEGSAYARLSFGKGGGES